MDTPFLTALPFIFSLLKYIYFEIMINPEEIKKNSTENSPVPFMLPSLMVTSYLTIVQFQSQETDIGTILLTGLLSSLLPLPSEKCPD